MTKQTNIGRAFALLTVTIFATVALASTANATGEVAVTIVPHDCIGREQDYGSQGSYMCTGIHMNNSGRLCIGEYTYSGYNKEGDCVGVQGPNVAVVLTASATGGVAAILVPHDCIGLEDDRNYGFYECFGVHLDNNGRLCVGVYDYNGFTKEGSCTGVQGPNAAVLFK